MPVPVNGATASLVSLTAAGASLLAAAALAGPAAAVQKCVLYPSSPRAPHLISPCIDATVARGGDVTFRVYDADPRASSYRPVLNLRSSRTVVDGRLAPDVSGNGIFAELTHVKGTRHTWQLVSPHQTYPTWWDNRPGTYYVQVSQVDARSKTAGLYDSPIVEIHVR